jgi:hypothetical protein
MYYCPDPGPRSLHVQTLRGPEHKMLTLTGRYLKGPKHEIFESGFLYLGTGEKNLNFESWSHYFKGFAANFLLRVRSACA